MDDRAKRTVSDAGSDGGANWRRRERGRADRPFADSQAIDGWLDDQPNPAGGHGRLARMTDQMEALAQSPEGIEALRGAHRYKAGPRQWLRRWGGLESTGGLPALATAAMVAMIIGVAAVMHFTVFGDRAEHHATARGEQRSVVLADGSTVRLNTLTSINVAYSKARRHVVLIEGQATFEVATDLSRPFVVSAGGGTVTALGTAFDIYKTRDKVTVTLLEGVVEVRRQHERSGTSALANQAETTTPAASLEPSPSQAVAADPGPARASPARASPARAVVTQLSPGEQVSIVRDGALSTVTKVDPSQVTAWQRGMIYLTGMSLEEAIAEVNRYADKRLVLADRELADLEIGGAFDAGDTAAFLRALELRFGLRPVQSSSHRVVLKRSSEG